MVDESECSNVLLAGDLNCHFGRNNTFTNIVENYLTEIGLKLLWENKHENEFIKEIDYTHVHIANQVASLSTIDHFAASQAVLLGVSEAGVLHEGENPSNHSAIYTKLNVGKFSTEVERIESEKRTNWRNATSNALNHFYETLGDRLRSIEAPECLSCQDVLCTKHGDSIEKYTVDILESIETAAKDSLPSTGGIQRRGKSIIPGWSEYVKPYWSESKFIILQNQSKVLPFLANF